MAEGFPGGEQVPSERIQRQIELFLDAPEEAAQRLDWGEARARSLAALALDAENADALAYLSAAEAAGGRRQESPPSPPREGTGLPQADQGEVGTTGPTAPT